MANLLSNTTVGGSAVITTSNIGSYAMPSSGGTLSGTITIGTSGSTSQTRALRIVNTGANPNSFGSYSGAWRSAIEIWDNSSNTMLFLAPPDGNNYNYSIIKSVGAGLAIDVGSAGGTNALTITAAGVVNAPQGLQVGGNSVVSTAGGQTIGGTTYFSGGESLNVYGIRGRFGGEYMHLYNKVGIGHPSGWGQGEGNTPGYGLSTYGGANFAYGNNADSTFNGVVYSTSSFRAPIFYDSQNTNYYGDFAGTSNLNVLYTNYLYINGTELTGTQTQLLKNTLDVTTLPYKVDITVNGDANTFYAVQFWGGDQDVWRRIIIKRGYGETAPWDPIGTGVHHGGLLLDWEGNFGGWGGAEYADRLRVFNESYTNVCADMFIYSHSMGYVFMLRGGGAVYHLFSDQPINGFYQSGAPDILYSTSTLSYDDTWSGTNQYDVPAPAPLSLAQVNSSRIDGLRTKKQSLLDNRYSQLGHTHDDRYYTESESDSRYWRNGVSNTWTPGTNIVLPQSANGQEWSFDITRNGYTGGYWHVWDSNHSTMLGVDATNNYVYATGSFRAPIFYDSADTSYYLDPASNSYLYGLQLSGNIYFRPSSWIQMDGNYGIYWPNHYGLHIYPNQSSYGALQINGSKGGYAGIFFNDSGVTLMMSSNESGNYRNGYGWQYRWYNGTFYVSTNAQGGGSEYSVIHSGNIGSQSVSYATTAGALSSMNISQFTNNSGYVAYGNYSWTSPVFGQYGIKSNLIDNVLYSAADRFEVFRDGVAWNTNAPFNLNYDQSCDTIPVNTSRTYSIVLNTKGNPSYGIVYTEGYLYLSFYYVQIPASVSGRVRFTNGSWSNISGWTNVANNGSYAVWRGNVPGGNYMVEIEITINANSSVDTWFAQWEYVMGRPGQYELGIINKAQDNSLWRNLYFKDSSNNTGVTINSGGISTSGTVTSQNFIATNAYYLNGTAYYLNSTNGGIYTNARFETAGNLVVGGTTYLGNANGDEVHINDVLRLGATDSGDAHFFFGEGSSAGSDYGSHWYWDSGYTFTWNTRNAGTDTALFSYVTNDTTYVNWYRNFHMQGGAINYTGQLHFSGGTRFEANNSNYLSFKTDSTSYGGIQVRDGNSTVRGYSAYYDSNGFGLLNSGGSWGIRLNPGNADTLLYYAGDWRLRTNSTGAGVNGYFYIDTSYGYGLVGLYSAERYQGVFAMGDSYKLPADGTSPGNLYGIAWTHSNVGGQSKSGLDHQALFMTNGITYTAIGNGIWTLGLITTTSYGTSANWKAAYDWGNHASAGYLTSGSLSGYATQSWVNSQGFLTSVSDVWVNTSGDTMTGHFMVDYNIATPSNYYSGLQAEIRATSGTAGIALHRNGYSHVGIYHDSTNELKFNMNSGTPILPANAGTLWGSGNLTNLNQLTNGPGYLRLNTWEGNSYIATGGAHYGTIFYDSNDTSYYVDPNGSTNVYAMYASSYRGNANVGGTGAATWHPDGIYCGNSMWQYGTMYKNGTGIYDVGQLKMNGGPYLETYNTRNLIVRGADSADAGILGRGSSNQFAFQLYGGGNGDYGFLDGAWANWDIRKTVDGAMYMNDNNSYYLHTNNTSNFYALTIQGNAVVHAGNIGSQSVSYASSAGSVSGLTLTSSSNGINPDSVTQNQIGYNTSVSLFGQTDGGLYSSAYSSSWVHQIYGDFRTGQIALRGKNSGSWQSWRVVLDSGNYTSYAPSLTGSGASGTWGINVTGSAGSVAWTNVSSRPTALSQFTNDLGNYGGWITSSGSISGSAGSVAWSGVTSKPAAWLTTDALVEDKEPSASAFPSGFYQSYLGSGNPTGTWFNYINVRHSNTGNGHGFQLGMSYYDNVLWFRSYQGSTSPTFQSWAYAISSQNIGSQSVNYANSAGSAGSATSASQLTKYGDIYGQDWNGYYLDGKFIAAAVYGMSGANKPPTSYDYGVALSYGESTGPRLQWYFPENQNNIGTIFRKGTYRTGWNGNWSNWKTLVEQEGNLCTIVGGNGTGLEVHGNVGYNQDPLTYFLLRGQADTSWKAFKVRLTGDAGGQDIEFRRIAENGADSRMFYVPRGGNTVNFDYPIVQPSDSRLKDNITPITTPVEKIKSLRGVEFDWNSGENKDTHDVGLIAQEVEAVLPEAVTTQEDGYKNLAYTKLIPLLVEGMKEQQAMIEALKAEIELLKNK